MESKNIRTSIIWCLLNFVIANPASSISSSLTESLLDKTHVSEVKDRNEKTNDATLSKPNSPEDVEVNNCNGKTNDVTLSKSYSPEDVEPQKKREKIEKQYTDYFTATRLPHNLANHPFWRALRILELYERKALQRMCKAAYTIWRNSDQPPEEVKPGMIRFPFFIIGSERSNYSIDVLPCIINPNGKEDETNAKEQFYITKGRRVNSVYFVKPTSTNNERGLPDDFILDERFDKDYDLSYDFAKDAKSVITEIFKEKDPII